MLIDPGCHLLLHPGQPDPVLPFYCWSNFVLDPKLFSSCSKGLLPWLLPAPAVGGLCEEEEEEADVEEVEGCMSGS